jgi:hypothetical protein
MAGRRIGKHVSNLNLAEGRVERVLAGRVWIRFDVSKPFAS